MSRPGSRLGLINGKLPDVVAGAAVGQHHVHVAVRRPQVGGLCRSAGRRRMGGSRGTALLFAVLWDVVIFLSQKKTGETQEVVNRILIEKKQ